MQIPDTGGKITVSLVESHASAKAGGGPHRTPKDRILAKLEQSAKLLEARPSDEVETFRFVVEWEPTRGALGTNTPAEFMMLGPDELQVVSILFACPLTDMLTFIGERQGPRF